MKSSSSSQYKLDAMGSDKMSMCRVLAQPTLESQAYTVSAELLNQAGWQGINSGHLGLLFNARDENNFDFVYFRWVLSPSFNGARMRDGQSERSLARARVTRACWSHACYSRTCCSNACCFLAERHLCREFFGRPFQECAQRGPLYHENWYTVAKISQVWDPAWQAKWSFKDCF